MKYKLLIIILSCIFLWTLYRNYTKIEAKQVTTTSIKSKGKFPTTQISLDAGMFPQDTVFEKKISLKNIGTEPIKIEEFNVSCNCTSASFSDSIVSPGDSVILKMQINTEKKKSGTHIVEGTIKTNGEKRFYRVKTTFEIK